MIKRRSQAASGIPSPNHADNIILIGMPAVGKSTLGVLLAKRLGYAFADTDLLIQTGAGATLQHIIADLGVEGFCDLEAEHVQRINPRRTVVATGGSVVYRPQAMAHLQKLGCILFLDIKLAALAERLKGMDARGVVRLPGQTIDQLFADRRPLYRRYAQITIDCTHCPPEAVLQKVLAALPTPGTH